MSARLEKIIELRRRHSLYDEELWSFVDHVIGRNLINLSDAELELRLKRIDENIQYLDDGATPRDHLHPDQAGWLSPWWWLRARHVTMLEFERRALVPAPTTEIPAMPRLAEGLRGTISGGRKMLVRISELHWLMDALNHGRLRFAHANSYLEADLNAARGDDELNKSYRRPGHAVTITAQNGKSINPIRDVEYSSVRLRQDGAVMSDVPYWFCSFSSDLDPRLFPAFSCGRPEDDGCLVIFDPYAFVQRALPALMKVAPMALKRLFPTDYFDPYYLDDREPSVIGSKDFRYACQREMRFVLDPAGGPALSDGSAVFASIGALTDIAAVYSRTGTKLAGIGPDNFLA